MIWHHVYKTVIVRFDIKDMVKSLRYKELKVDLCWKKKKRK